MTAPLRQSWEGGALAPGWVVMSMRRRWTYVDRGRDYAGRHVDCYGFVLGASAEFFGIVLPDPLYASSHDPRETGPAVDVGRGFGARISRASAREGDVVLIRRANRWHAALYGGADRVLQLTLGGVSYPSIAQGPLASRVEGFYRVRAC